MKNALPHIPSGSGLLNAKHILDNHLGLFHGAHVADLGCGGAAYFTLQAARQVGEDGLVYAVDILKEILSNVEVRAKMAGLSNIRTVWSNIEIYGATKITDASIDFALLVNVLFQNKQPEKMLKEATRMTKKGGKLIVVDWKQGRFPIGPDPQQKILPEHVKELAPTIGLKEVASFDAGQFHYGVIFEKVV